MLKDETTIEDRQAKSKILDSKCRKMIKEISYKDDGELYLNNIHNSCMQKIIRMKKLKKIWHKLFCKCVCHKIINSGIINCERCNFYEKH
jgi:hypothetical protein